MSSFDDANGTEHPRQFLSPQEFVRLSGLSLATVYRYVDRGQLPCRQPGGKRCRILIPMDALQQFQSSTPSASESNAAKPQSAGDGNQTPRLSGPRPRWARSEGPG